MTNAPQRRLSGVQEVRGGTTATALAVLREAKDFLPVQREV
jgi:hypothetical protein